MKTASEIQSEKRLSNITFTDTGYIAGYGYIKFPRWSGTVFFDAVPGRWEHVSVSPKKINILLNWYELKELKRIFWPDTEEVVQFFPRAADHVNLMQNCLHLWRHPEVETLCSKLEGR